MTVEKAKENELRRREQAPEGRRPTMDQQEMERRRERARSLRERNRARSMRRR